MRGLLLRAGYTRDGLQALGVDVGLGVRHGDVPILARALGDTEPLATLVRLFLFADVLPRNRVERALGADLGMLVAAGLVDARGDRVAATCSLTPWRDGVIAHDPDPPGDLWPDHVTGPNPAAETLADLVVPTHAVTALDLGTGSGALAVLAARQADRVIATDINARALWLASVSAALSDAAAIETREGNLFEPVRGTQFNLILANPPFVIGPETDLVFRFSPLPRDAMSRTVVSESGAHLAEGGYAQILCNWVQPRGTDWQDVLRRWVAGTGCDALLLLHGVEDPLSYAVRWNLRVQQLRPERYGALLDRWLEHLQREQIEAIGSGVVILRRRTGGEPNWVHGIRLTGDPRPPAGAHVVATFAARDYLAATHDDDARLLATRFRIAAAHRIDQALLARGDDVVIEAASLVLEQGLGNRQRVEPDLLPVLLRLDGTQSLGEVVDEMAATGEIDVATFRPRAVAFVRDLLEGGFAIDA